jgi:uncharacterized 2Fe-2S/4Fe-4S cluster protein (DUF4445 family)
MTVYGMAVDVGSTTIAAHLCDLPPARSSRLPADEPADPLWRRPDERVSYVMMNPAVPEMTRKPCARRSTSLPASWSKDADVERDDVLDATFVGNPVMHHLILGIDPTELGGAPFRARRLRRGVTRRPRVSTLS